MKKLLLLLPLLYVFTPVFAQKGKVSQAINFLETGKPERALEIIEWATNPDNEKSVKTINWPRAWEVRGDIYQVVYHHKNTKADSFIDDPLVEAFNSYKKAIELDLNKKHYKSLKIKITLLANDLIEYAARMFNDENYQKSVEAFEYVIELYKMPVFETDGDAMVDTVILFNTGLAAFKATDYEKALKYSDKLISIGYKGAESILFKSNIYLQKEDLTSALEVLKQGYIDYPDNITILSGIIDIYLNTDNKEGAMEYLSKAIQLDPENATYYLIKGNLYEKMGEDQNTVNAYEKAINLDPEMFMAYFNLGVFYFNNGVKQVEIANKIPAHDNIGYERELKKATEWWEKSLPYMEKCYEINSEDITTIESLRNLYYRLNLMDKYDKIQQPINNQ